MHSLVAITPLGNTEPVTDQIGSVTITEVTDRALASVSCRPTKEAAFAATTKKLFGAAMPDPGHWSARKSYRLMWTAPGQWFVDAPFASHEDIAARMKAALGDTASITEQTDGWAHFDIAGVGAVDVLERLCAVASRRMQTGHATRTLIDHLGCFVACREAGAAFSVSGPRSSAASLHHALCAAARSIA